MMTKTMVLHPGIINCVWRMLRVRIHVLVVFVVVQWLCTLSLSCDTGIIASRSQDCITFNRDDVFGMVKEYAGTSNISYYRYLWLHKDSLYVGAMNKLFKFNKKDISSGVRIIIKNASERDKRLCRNQGVPETPDCQNHIRFITVNQSMSTPDDDVLYVCGTGSYNPTGYLIHSGNLSQIHSFSSRNGGNAICGYDPFDNITALYVSEGNPGNMPGLYSAAYADMTKSTPVIYRSPLFNKNETQLYVSLKPRHKDIRWLNEPQFVGSFDAGDVVYFFMREVAQEHTSCGQKVYSRVVRVCKSDKGGLLVVQHQWTSFQKARLNCSIPGASPSYFDEIQDVKRDGDMFYALFTRSGSGVTGSAVCVYRKADIEAAFQGPFQADGDVPTPRPGDCSTISDSRMLSHTFMTFVMDHILMKNLVPPHLGRPIFQISNELLLRLELHVSDGHAVIFAGANTGAIYQLYQPSVSMPQTIVSAIIHPIEKSGPVWSMQLDASEHQLYVGYDRVVVQLSLLDLCERYRKADACIFNPYCLWDAEIGVCRRWNQTLLDGQLVYCPVAEEWKEKQQFESWVRMLRRDTTEVFDDSVSLGTTYTMPLQLPVCVFGTIRWYHYARQLHINEENGLILGTDDSLTIRSITRAHEGNYVASDESGFVLANYRIKVIMDHTGMEKLWKDKFHEWCREFEDYKNRVKEWTRQTCQSPSSADEFSNTIAQLP